MTSDPDTQTAHGGGETGSPKGKRLLFLLPMLIFLVVAGYFAWGLLSDRDPSEVPSALIDKPVPQFDLSPVEGLDTPGLKTADLTDANGPVLLNVWASWCVPCRAEHPVLMRLAERDDVTLYGVNYKDEPADARQFINNLGNPFTRIGADRSGRTGIELGVYGVPETYVIGPSGKIRYKHTGPIDAKALNENILPLLQRLSG
ncbi:DsbE family thiol:disulfide interchange protein [Rhodovibrio salinarum]|uniref:DsbE family thiol:disulfide interchange protein n=1 Tax=Rhodovibrio salinarum TaxID=1087 RepID=A0A934QGU1_9PROT|nr:DsbE family thiol:disulfide interchange protein [Rhodovibrio salinarum]MBK1696751.1 DsbE family thiol:disulfide interchange protein [Rhodovibrio salinarum]